jgi:hypothetical protein
LEGPAATLAVLVEALYQDHHVPRQQWSLANAEGVGRRAMVERLRAEGRLVRRLGVAALTLPLCDAIEHRARSAGLKCSIVHMPTVSQP